MIRFAAMALAGLLAGCLHPTLESQSPDAWTAVRPLDRTLRPGTVLAPAGDGAATVVCTQDALLGPMPPIRTAPAPEWNGVFRVRGAGVGQPDTPWVSVTLRDATIASLDPSEAEPFVSEHRTDACAAAVQAAVETHRRIAAITATVQATAEVPTPGGTTEAREVVVAAQGQIGLALFDLDETGRGVVDTTMPTSGGVTVTAPYDAPLPSR